MIFGQEVGTMQGHCQVFLFQETFADGESIVVVTFHNALEGDVGIELLSAI